MLQRKYVRLFLHIVISAFQLHFLISLALDFTAAFVSFKNETFEK